MKMTQINCCENDYMKSWSSLIFSDDETKSYATVGSKHDSKLQQCNNATKLHTSYCSRLSWRSGRKKIRHPWPYSYSKIYEIEEHDLETR